MLVFENTPKLQNQIMNQHNINKIHLVAVFTDSLDMKYIYKTDVTVQGIQF